MSRHRSEPQGRGRGTHRSRGRRSLGWRPWVFGGVASIGIAATIAATDGRPSPSSTAAALEPVPTIEPSAKIAYPPTLLAAPRPTPSAGRSSDVKVEQPRPLRVPERGSGEFIVAADPSSSSGSASLMTYSVEVEKGLTLSLAGVASTVERVLGDERSWNGEGDHQLARTDSDPDLRILLATPETTDQLCAPLDTGGRLSCRDGDLVVLNAWRWVHGAASYGSDLRNYRRYLVNHEVGHALGKAHESCPGSGELAPVMMQQTKGIAACEANPWPVPG